VSYSLFSGLATAPWATPELAAGEIRLADARALDALWVDARSDSDYNAAHYPGAYSLNPENWDLQLSELVSGWLAHPRPILVYCKPQDCSASQVIAGRLRENLPDAEVYSILEGWSLQTKETTDAQ
jgi:rhodanese-related sulfurtransferase